MPPSRPRGTISIIKIQVQLVYDFNFLGLQCPVKEEKYSAKAII